MAIYIQDTWQLTFQPHDNLHSIHMATYISNTRQFTFNTHGNLHSKNMANFIAHTWQITVRTHGNSQYTHTTAPNFLIHGHPLYTLMPFHNYPTSIPPDMAT